METTLIISFLVAAMLGVMLHFTHKRKSKGFLLHMVSAVNESTWEHMKLAFMPMIMILSIQYIWIGDEYSNFWMTGFLSSLVAMWLIPILYYPIRYLVKREILAVSISIYFVSMFAAFLLEYLLLSNEISFLPEWVGIVGLATTFTLFGVFTYSAPNSELFRCPVSGKCGD